MIEMPKIISYHLDVTFYTFKCNFHTIMGYFQDWNSNDGLFWHTHTHINIYVYIQRERERERLKQWPRSWGLGRNAKKKEAKKKCNNFLQITAAEEHKGGGPRF